MDHNKSLKPSSNGCCVWRAASRYLTHRRMVLMCSTHRGLQVFLVILHLELESLQFDGMHLNNTANRTPPVSKLKSEKRKLTLIGLVLCINRMDLVIDALHVSQISGSQPFL